jgi:hypothetical protein
MAIGTDGVIYAVTARDLIKINPVTGVGTVIAGLSPVPAGPINDLSFQGGRLMGTYASGWQAVSFTTNGFEINTTTGAVTSLWTGPQGPGDQRRGLEYLNGVMYWGNISDYSRAIQTPLYDLNMDTGAKSSAVTARGVHAAYSMGIYDGEVYVVALSTTFSNASLDNLTLVRMDSSMSTGTYIGDLPSGFSTIAGTP